MADGFTGAAITEELNRRRTGLIAKALLELQEMYPGVIY